MRNPPEVQLNKEASFWIVTGILFLFIWITPFYLAYKSVVKIPELKIIDYLAYAVIILLFTKASLCKSQKAI